MLDGAAIPFALDGLDGNPFRFDPADGTPTLLVFFETDCPTCRLMFPYLARLARELASEKVRIIGISQDGEPPTREFVDRLNPGFPILLDRDLTVSERYDPLAVPTLFLIGSDGTVSKTLTAFDKAELNALAGELFSACGLAPRQIAEPFDGAPERKPGCTSRHLEPRAAEDAAGSATAYVAAGKRASRIELDDDVDPIDYCLDSGFDFLPVVPPTVARVNRMLAAVTLPPEEVVALVPPNYGAATVEKIAANAVMAGCTPEMMRVLVPLVRAVCDETFNVHGVQATTHYATPLTIVNGPIRRELGFASGGNVFGNVSRTNSSVGRALQLILGNIGGARPGGIDMSTLGSPAKFSYCIAENEEESPWEPLHVELGFRPDQSTVSLFTGEAPHGFSEHNARTAKTLLKAVCPVLATVFSYRLCTLFEAIVVFCPEHVKTLAADGFSKQNVRDFLFENTGVPVRHFDDLDGEGVQYGKFFESVTINGEACYRKFRDPSQIKIVVAGGTAGKYSAVIASWATGPMGSRMVTYPIE